jgi:hypothetical protein
MGGVRGKWSAAAVELGLQLGDAAVGGLQLAFELQHAADGGQGHRLIGEPDDVLDERDLVP